MTQIKSLIMSWGYFLMMLIGIPQLSWADLKNDMHRFFDGLGYMSNTTAPAAFQGQAAGYYTGGSLYLRNQVNNYQLASIELPDFSGGCSGIDMYLGSFSVINDKQLLKMVKNILSAGGAYAMDLALTTTLPQVRSVKDSLQKYINAINSTNINSCNVAEDLVGGMWPKTQSSQQQICRDISSHNGVFTDWASARQGCGVGGEFDKGLGDGGKRQSEVVVNKNIVWDALMNNAFTREDVPLSEVLMSLSGSFVIKKGQDGNPNKNVLPSLADHQLIKGLLHGDTSVRLYSCDEPKKCLNPTLKSVPIKKEAGLAVQVAKLINQLNGQVLSDSGTISPKVRGFLEMTPIPILKMISTEAALGRPLDSTHYSEVIAIGLLSQYLAEDIKIVKQAMAQEDTPLDGLVQSRIEAAQIEITRHLTEAYRQLQNTHMVVTNMRSQDKQLSSRVASQAATGQEQ